MFRHSRSRFAGLLGIALILSGCGLQSTDSQSKSSADLKIGTSLPLTGQASEDGKESRRGYQVWAKTVNDKGGLLGRKISLVVKDDATNQNTVVADYNALISRDKVDLLLGSYSSLLNFPASAIAEKKKMLYVTPTGGAEELYKRGFKTIFLAQPALASGQGDVFSDYLTEPSSKSTPKSVAYVTVDDSFTKPVVDSVKKNLEHAGIRTAYFETYANDLRNFDTLAEKIKNSGADTVVQGASFNDAVGLIRSLNKVNYKPKTLYQTSAPSLGSQYADAVGKENTNGVFYSTSWAPNASTTGNNEFIAAYRKMFPGSEPSESAADAYAAGQVLAEAVTHVGSIDDQMKLADWLRGNSVDTILGAFGWNANGSPKGNVLLGQWQKNKVEIVRPESAATSKTVVSPWRTGS
ncbi:amino acid ABC transporter substrate-binding protein [Streptomyces sp. NPDC057621]|uniref:amino acid ABC transporter substrate-binding protein n=1 Tax=Streptomyces sp. NPDC057621 TaxID=3346186 RepID=UPI00367B38B4